MAEVMCLSRHDLQGRVYRALCARYWVDYDNYCFPEKPSICDYLLITDTMAGMVGYMGWERLIKAHGREWKRHCKPSDITLEKFMGFYNDVLECYNIAKKELSK